MSNLYTKFVLVQLMMVIYIIKYLKKCILLFTISLLIELSILNKVVLKNLQCFKLTCSNHFRMTKYIDQNCSHFIKGIRRKVMCDNMPVIVSIYMQNIFFANTKKKHILFCLFQLLFYTNLKLLG